MSDQDQEPVQQSPDQSKKGYGSRWKRLVLIYLIVAVVVYGFIWFAFIRDGSGGGFSY